MVPVAWVLAAWRAPRTPAGLGIASALLFLLFVVFAKQAFCNYYYLVLGCICCGLAVLAPPTDGDNWAPMPKPSGR